MAGLRRFHICHRALQNQPGEGGLVPLCANTNGTALDDVVELIGPHGSNAIELRGIDEAGPLGPPNLIEAVRTGRGPLADQLERPLSVRLRKPTRRGPAVAVDHEPTGRPAAPWRYLASLLTCLSVTWAIATSSSPMCRGPADERISGNPGPSWMSI